MTAELNQRWVWAGCQFCGADIQRASHHHWCPVIEAAADRSVGAADEPTDETPRRGRRGGRQRREQ